MSWLTDLFGCNKPRLVSRALWVWHLEWNGDQLELVSLLKRKEIQEVYLCVGKEVSKVVINNFIDLAHAQGTKVQYLEGVQVNGTEDPNKALGRIISVLEGVKWDGVHIDYEIAKGCPTKVFNSFLEKVLKGIYDQNVVVDLEWWRADQEYFTLVSLLADSICIMGYANNYWDTRGKVQKALNRIKIPFRFGVETIDDPAVKDISFWNLGENKMEKMIQRIDCWARNKQGYQGVAIHHYDSYRRLRV